MSTPSPKSTRQPRQTRTPSNISGSPWDCLLIAPGGAVTKTKFLGVPPPSHFHAMGSVPCTIEEFTHFFNARAYDIVGEGSFRKHLNACKEAGDDWAVDMANGVQKVLMNIKAVHTHISKLEQSYPKLGKICKQVALSAHPPVRLHAGAVQCALTQQQCTNSLGLPSGQKGNPVFVHVRFCRFFMFVWFVCKIEYVVRCFVRSWVQGQDASNLSYQNLADKLGVLLPLVKKIHTVFLIALDHVYNSIEQLDVGQKSSVIGP